MNSGYGNIFAGYRAGGDQTSGDSNILIGAYCGNDVLSPTGSYQLRIANDQIGAEITNAQIQGIKGTTPSGTLDIVVIGDNDQLGSASINIPLTSNFTATLDSGTITTMTVRGITTTTVPISLAKIGTTVTMTIPEFHVMVQTGGAFTITLTGVGVINALYRPTYALSFMIPIINNALFTSAIVYVSAGGIVSMQLLSGVAFTLPTGPGYDCSFSWNIV